MDSSTDRPYRLGVLFVHGIGNQRPGETLVRWADALVGVLAQGTRDQVAATVDDARIGDREAITQARVTIRRDGAPPEPWLISEAWWADSFPAPTYGELVSWSIRALPWSIAFYIAQRYWQARPQSWLAKALSGVLAFLRLAAALVVAPVLLLFLAISLVLGALPIPQLRSWILAAQSALTATVGDTLAFVESPLRAALIRSRILAQLEWLKPHCDRTIVVAHSQGAAVVLDTLGAIRLAGQPARDCDPLLVPDALLTFGAGTNQLVSNKVVASRLSKLAADNPVGTAIWAVAGTVAVAVWMFADVTTGRTSASDLVRAFAVWCAAILALTAVALAGLWAVRAAGRKWKLVGEREPLVAGIVLTPVLIAIVFGVFYMDRAHLPFGPVSFLILGFMGSIGSIAVILSSEVKAALSAVHRPSGLKNWVDIFASADPVPNGPTLAEGDAGPHHSIPIWNRGSILSDHTAYWDNRDSFVLRVVKMCGQTAGSPWVGALPPDSDYVDQRARWRVSWLRVIRWVAAIGVVAGGLTEALINRHQVVVPFDLPRWVPLAAAQYVVIVGATFLAMRAVGWILTLVWQRWVAAEQNLVLSHGTPTGKAWLDLTAMATIPWLLFLVAWFVFTPGSMQAIDDWQDIVVMPFGAAGFALVSVFALVTIMPPPKPPSSESQAARAVASVQP